MLSMLGVTAVGQMSTSCCDRRAPECQARYGTCMASTGGSFQSCDPIFCVGEPYPIPTVCCDPQSSECKLVYERCLIGTYGSTTLCSSVFCRSETPTPTRAPCCNLEFMRCETMTNICPESKCCNKLLNVCPPDAPICPTTGGGGSADVPSPTMTPFPSRLAEPSRSAFPSMPVLSDVSPFPSRMVEPSKSALPSMPVLSDASPFPSRMVEPSKSAFPSMPVLSDASPFPSRSAMVSQSSDPTKRPLVDSPTATLPNMTPRPLPTVDHPSHPPTRKPRPSPKFSPFPSPKIIRPVPSVLPREFVSVAKFDSFNQTEITKIPKLKEIQVKLSCIFRTAVEKIKIRNVTIIKENGIRQIIKWNATEFDTADVPEVDCLAPNRLLRGLQASVSNIEVEYEVVDPPAEAFTMDVSSITAPTANAPTSSESQSTVQASSQPSPVVVGIVGAASALVVVAAVVAVMKYIDRQRRVSPLNTRQQRVRVSMNPLELASRSTVGSSTRSAFNPQRSRV